MSYEEILLKNPDQTLWRADDFYREASPEATEKARLGRKKEIGYLVKFIQENGLTRRVLCDSAPDLPDNFFVYLRDITPECLYFYRTGYMKWMKRFERNMNADPADVRVLEQELKKMRGNLDKERNNFKRRI